MSEVTFFKPTITLIRKTLKILHARGIKNATVTFQDIGDLYHIYGVNASATHLADALERRSRA